MSDQEALDEFSFDIRWRYALDISEEDDYLSRRFLEEFCRRLAAKDPEMKLVRNVFDTIRDSALRKLEVYTKDQRLDSTHIISNIRIHKTHYDPDVSYGHKGEGYSLHVAETCNNPDKPEIITDHEVHSPGRSDIAKALPVIDRLRDAGLKPETLFADGGYPSVPSALKIIEQQIEFMTPVNLARLTDDVVGRNQFEYDTNGYATKCPMGHSPIDHRILSSNNKTNRSLHAIFDDNTCRACSMLDQYPVRAPNHRKRGCPARDTIGDFRLEVTAELRLRDQMYADQQTPQWKERYKIRFGIEATFSELKWSYGMGRLRIRRAVKVLFAVSCKLITCNVRRWANAHFAFFKGVFSVVIIRVESSF